MIVDCQPTEVEVIPKVGHPRLHGEACKLIAHSISHCYGQSINHTTVGLFCLLKLMPGELVPCILHGPRHSAATGHGGLRWHWGRAANTSRAGCISTFLGIQWSKVTHWVIPHPKVTCCDRTPSVALRAVGNGPLASSRSSME